MEEKDKDISGSLPCEIVVGKTFKLTEMVKPYCSLTCSNWMFKVAKWLRFT